MRHTAWHAGDASSPAGNERGIKDRHRSPRHQPGTPGVLPTPRQRVRQFLDLGSGHQRFSDKHVTLRRPEARSGEPDDVG